MIIGNKLEKNITALVVSFLREDHLAYCLNTLRKQYPNIKIVVGDNGGYHDKKKKICKKYNAEYNKLPYDCGICVGRNRLIDKIDTKYVLVGDDDFYYDKDAKIVEMAKLLEKTDFDLVGGRVKIRGNVHNYQGYMKHEAGRLLYKKLELKDFKKENIRYKPCDITFNFFVAKKEALTDVKWDEKIKVAYEHSSFFIKFKEKGYKVAFTPDSVVGHKPKHIKMKPKRDKKYRKHRGRKTDKTRFFEKFRLHYAVDMNGNKAYRDRETDIDFLITTMLRPNCLERLLKSIAEYYPLAKITIADQGKKFNSQGYKNMWKLMFKKGMKIKPTAWNMPFDCGLSVARNKLVNETKKPYVLILEDDFIFTGDSDILKFKEIMETDPKIGVVGGKVIRGKQELHYEHKWERDGDKIKHIHDGNNWEYKKGIKCKETGSVLNFALMRREIFKDVKWNEDIKIAGEHSAFYIDLDKTDWKVYYTPEVSIKSKREEKENPQYRKLRKRDKFLKRLFKQYNFKKVVHTNGRVMEYDPEEDKIIKYRNK